MPSLLDTNILVYADAADEPTKQRRALALITALRTDGTAVLCTQVLQAFVNFVLRKLRLPQAGVSGCQRVLSEDMQHGAVHGGVRIENPFIGA